jgi:thiamine-monophosphate kinase
VREDELVAAIARLTADDAPGVIAGIGDDAAVVRIGDRVALLTTDMLVEDVDFELATMGPRDIGYRAMAANLSDVAAMGGSPRFVLVGLGMKAETDPRFVIELFSGIREAADEHAAAVVGGDLSSANRLVVSISLVGEAGPGDVVLRSGARAGDRIVVTGALGAAAAGLRLLREGPRAIAAARAAGWGDETVRAFLRPAARVGEGQALARAGATAMMDVSDGLAIDLGRLCSASHSGAQVWLDRLPVAVGASRLASERRSDAKGLALSGGEDFELLAAMPAAAVRTAAETLRQRYGTPLTEIGEITAEPGLVSTSSAGSDDERPLAAAGWDHFAQ